MESTWVYYDGEYTFENYRIWKNHQGKYILEGCNVGKMKFDSLLEAQMYVDNEIAQYWLSKVDY